MGIHICLFRPDGTDHPDWDAFRHAGDRDFIRWMEGLADIKAPDDNVRLDGAFRPAAIVEWRARLPADRPNPDRFLRLFDLLEADPDLWIYYSI